ncbi:MAG TPA: permease prefix domain 1-containing protein [Kribbellaceae bacterium]|jgi:hypothetical protein
MRRVTVIDAYLAELGTALRGPRRAKADLLAEARDSLADAAEAHEARGMDRVEAERAAVAEFGDLQEVAPGYQSELGLAQARRTGLLVFFLLISQPFVWNVAWPAISGRSPDGGEAAAVALDSALEWVGGLTMVAALLMAAACGIGVRYLGVRRGVTRATGVLVLTASTVIGGAGLLLTAMNADAGTPAAALALAWTTAFVVVPFGYAALSARRCLAAAWYDLPPSADGASGVPG